MEPDKQLTQIFGKIGNRNVPGLFCDPSKAPMAHPSINNYFSIAIDCWRIEENKKKNNAIPARVLFRKSPSTLTLTRRKDTKRQKKKLLKCGNCNLDDKTDKSSKWRLSFSSPSLPPSPPLSLFLSLTLTEVFIHLPRVNRQRRMIDVRSVRANSRSFLQDQFQVIPNM